MYNLQATLEYLVCTLPLALFITEVDMMYVES